jgi:REP-associated tyrosine transposase
MASFTVMPRKKRLEASGLIHHSCMHAVDGELVFRCDEDRIGYLVMLRAAVISYGWHCLSYCLMGTHLHLLVETPEPNFGDGMRWLHGHYGRCFNRHHGRRGHLFQGRYHDEPVLKEAHLLSVVPYIAANPVEAGICRDPRDWFWGSHRAVAAGTPARWTAHDRLVDHLEAITGSRDAYGRLLDARLRGAY